MEDLIPFLIFIVIAVVNLVKFLAEKGGRKKKTPSSSDTGTAPPKRRSSTLETFFEDLAAKLEPQPTELADWPENRERPDYMKEMEDVESARTEASEKERAAEIIPIPPPEPAWNSMADMPDIQSASQAETLKMAMKSMPSSITSLKGLRMASTPILRSSSAGRVDFPLDNRAALRKAIIANLIFSPPRVYEASFDNTITK